VVELPWAAHCCPWVEKLRTVLPLTVGIRDSAVQLVLTHQRVRTCSGERVRTCSGVCVWVLQQEPGSTHMSPVYTVHRVSPPPVPWGRRAANGPGAARSRPPPSACRSGTPARSAAACAGPRATRMSPPGLRPRAPGWPASYSPPCACPCDSTSPAAQPCESCETLRFGTGATENGP
jgi:hypothetical protein